MWPTLREFLAEGFYPIPPIPRSREGLRATGVRQPSEQALDLFAATPGQHVTVKTDFDVLDPLKEILEDRLDLDEPVSAEIPLQFARCAAQSRNAAAVEGPNLKDELQRAYDIVNNLVRSSLRKEAMSSGKWTPIDDQSADQAHLAFDKERPGDTFVSGTPDAICAVDAKRETPALALLESTVTAVFSDDRDLRRQKATMRSEQGMIVYLSHASRKLRTWNSNLRNGAAQFWVNFLAQIWEEMHQYRAQCLITTSWKFTSLFKRASSNEISCSPISNFEDDLTGRMNMLEMLTAFALTKEGDHMTEWQEFPNAPSLLRQDSGDRSGDITPMPSPPPATVTITGIGDKTNRTVAQLSMVYGANMEERDRFPSGPSSGSYSLQLGDSAGRGRTYDCYKVRHTNIVPSASCDMIAKVVNLATFPVRDAKWKRSRQATKQAVKDEAALFEGPLSSLQGNSVPMFFGLWIGTVAPTTLGNVSSKDYAMNGNVDTLDHSHEIMIMLLEDVGKAIADRSEYVGDFDTVDIVDLYERLHAVNVVHGDVGVKHVTRMNHGDLRLIDFENSWEVDPEKPKEYVDLLDEKRTLLREFKQAIPPELENLVPPWEMKS